MHKVSQMKLDALERFATSFRADYRFAPLNIMMLVGICLLGLVIHLAVSPFNLDAVITMIGTAVVLATVFRLFQVWESVVVFTTGAALYVYLQPPARRLDTGGDGRRRRSPQRRVSRWPTSGKRRVVLRFGRFRGLKGSGLFTVFPVIDKVANYVDQRIRVTDFKAETTLTKDTVPVNVDAIAFWMVWDAEKSVLEVEDFDTAVSLSAQTGLRDSIGSHELGDMLSHRDRLGKEIQGGARRQDQRLGYHRPVGGDPRHHHPQGARGCHEPAGPGRTRAPVADHSVHGREEIAERFASASKHYKHNPAALHLRAMNMVFEGLKQKGSMIIVPSTAVETMGLGAMGGLTAFDRIIEKGDDPIEVAKTPDASEASEE